MSEELSGSAGASVVDFFRVTSYPWRFKPSLWVGKLARATSGADAGYWKKRSIAALEALRHPKSKMT
jgi:hypothetical protein